ncbi:MAG: hypothetical protein HYZ28_15355 [Myxococcales bacterium]|nr:hypothetical protein [Myxococcales bacterium]
MSASDDYSSTSGPAYSSPCDQLAFSGKDVVYEFRPAAGGSFTATLQPSGSFDAALLLLQPVCGAGSCTAVSDRPGQGLSETLTFSGTAGQSYFLVVDAWDGQSGNSSGSFAIRVQ